MSNAAAVIYARALLAHENALELSGIKLLAGGVMALLAVAAVDGSDVAPRMDLGAWALLLTLGVTSNAVGRTMYLSLIRSAGSVRASLVAYVVPAVGVLLGWLVLGERLGASGIAGLTLIAGSMALVTHGEQLGAMVRHVRRRLDVTMPVLAR
jgi:DME family drug/metabolite transporter